MAFSRQAKKSVAGVFFGCLLIPGSIALHAWNEYRTIHRTRGLKEAATSVVSVPDINRVDDTLEKQLVHLTGVATTEQYLDDDVFGVQARAIHLQRQVEMYQWVEHEHENSEGHIEYSYSKQWEEDRVNSSDFHHGGHDNPTLRYRSQQWTAEYVTVGSYDLNRELKQSVDSWETLPINEAAVLETMGGEATGVYEVISDQLYWSQNQPDPDSPELGDFRIRFRKVAPTDVSLVSMQVGNTFEEFHTSNGEAIQRLYTGQLTAEQVFDRLFTENTLIAWGLRLLGLVLCFFGFSMILGPISAIVSWIPILRELTGALILVVSGGLAIIVSLTTISVSWIAVRPFLGVVLLTLAAGLTYVLFRLRKSQTSEPQVIDASMIVDP